MVCSLRQILYLSSHLHPGFIAASAHGVLDQTRFRPQAGRQLINVSSTIWQHSPMYSPPFRRRCPSCQGLITERLALARGTIARPYMCPHCCARLRTIGSDAFSFGHDLARRFFNAVIMIMLVLIWTIWSPWIACALFSLFVFGWLISDRFIPILIVPARPSRAHNPASNS